MNIKKVMTIIGVFSTLIWSSDTLILRRGIDNHPGLIEASIHNPQPGSHMGGPSLKCGSSWC